MKKLNFQYLMLFLILVIFFLIFHQMISYNNNKTNNIEGFLPHFKMPGFHNPLRKDTEQGTCHPHMKFLNKTNLLGRSKKVDKSKEAEHLWDELKKLKFSEVKTLFQSISNNKLDNQENQKTTDTSDIEVFNLLNNHLVKLCSQNSCSKDKCSKDKGKDKCLAGKFKPLCSWKSNKGDYIWNHKKNK